MMNKDIKNVIIYLSISIFTLIFGVIFYGIYNEIIIINLPTKKSYTGLSNNSKQKKIFKVFFPKANKLNIEEKELIYSDNIIETSTYLVTSFLNLNFDENVIPKKVSVQAILVDTNQKELYISFDRNFLPKETSIFNKLLVIESLLKTIRMNLPTITSIHLLANHKLINDKHFDFSHALPTTGYLEK